MRKDEHTLPFSLPEKGRPFEVIDYFLFEQRNPGVTVEEKATRNPNYCQFQRFCF